MIVCGKSTLLHKPNAPPNTPNQLLHVGGLKIGLLEYAARRLRSKIPETPVLVARRLRPRLRPRLRSPVQSSLEGGPESGPETGPETLLGPETPVSTRRRLRSGRRLRPSQAGDSGVSELQRLYFEVAYKYLSPTSSQTCDFHSLSSINAAHQSFKISLPSH